MTLKETLLAKVEEKQKKAKATHTLTVILIVVSTFVFVSIFLLWFFVREPSFVSVPVIYSWGALLIFTTTICSGFAYKSILKNDIIRAFTLVAWALVSGIVFFVTQLIGLQSLIESGAFYKNIVFPIASLHWVYTLIGLIFLGLVFVRIKDGIVHSKSKAFTSNVFKFWYFLGVVWIVLITMFK